MIRTKAGWLLENLLHGMKGRYLLCWNGKESKHSYDCACCITYLDDERRECGCICHDRIERMALDISAILLAAEANGEMPRFYTSEADMMAVLSKQFEEHKNLPDYVFGKGEYARPEYKFGKDDCPCDDCIIVRRINAR